MGNESMRCHVDGGRICVGVRSSASAALMEIEVVELVGASARAILKAIFDCGWKAMGAASA